MIIICSGFKMEQVVNLVSIFLLFAVIHSESGEIFSSSKLENFRSKNISPKLENNNILRVVRETGSTNVEELNTGEEEESNIRPLTKRNLRALQNKMSRIEEIVENLDEKICRKQSEENSTLIEPIEKIAAKLESLEQEMCNYFTKTDYHSLLQKVEDTQRHVVRKPDLQSVQDNILYAVKPQLKRQEQCADYTKDNPKITKEDLLQYLKSIPDSRKISGSILDLLQRASSRNLIHSITGVQPGIRSIYIHHAPDLILDWESDLEEAMTQWNNNSLLILQWFPCPPTTSESCGPEILKQLNTSEWNDLITEGGHLNKLWKIRLNTMLVPSLKKLESAGVVVIFDPFLAVSLGFWYAENRAVTGSRRLYQMTYDYLTKKHKLTSMIWKWSVYHTPDLETYMEQLWPGNEYVDAASVVLVRTREPSAAVYQKMMDIVGDKPMSMEWFFFLPTAELLKRQPRWTWFTVLESVSLIGQPNVNSRTVVQDLFQNPAVINQDGIEITKSNYALKGKATASSVQNADLEADLAIDGNNSTRWSSQFSDPQWIQVDLGKVRFVKEIRILWEVAFGKGYQIQASEDNVNWKIVHEEYNGNGGVEDISITVPLLARYIKLFGFQRGTGYGYSIFELEVY